MTLALAIVAGVLLPGLAGAVLLTPRGGVPSVGKASATFVATGICSLLLLAGVTETAVGVTTASVAVGAVLVGLASVAVVALPRRRAVLLATLRDFRQLGLITLVATVTWAPMAVLNLMSTEGPPRSTPWYYWGLAEAVLVDGRVPETTVEFGQVLPTLDDYHLFTVATAWLMRAAGGSADVAALVVMLVLAVLSLATGATFLAQALGAGPLVSLLAAPLALGTGLGTVRLSAYRPEAFGMGLCVLLAAFVALALRRRDDWRPVVVSALLAAVLSQVHGIALVTSAALCVGVALALWPRTGSVRAHLRRGALTAGALVLAILMVGVLIGGPSGAGQTDGMLDVGGIDDPTWEFVRAITAQPPSEPPTNLAIAESALRSMYRDTWWWVVPLLVAALAVALLRFRAGELARRTVLFVIGSLAVLLVLAAVLALGWDSYVPRRTGAQRLVQQSTVLVGPLVALGAAVGVPWRVPDARRRVQVAVGALALLTLGGALATLRLATSYANNLPEPGDVAALTDLDVPDDAVVLTNAFTEGYVERVTGAESLLEGRAPYTYPEVLQRVNGLLREAAAFYSDPRASRDFLAEHDVGYVIVAKPRSDALGTSNIFRVQTRVRALGRIDSLEKVVDRPGFKVYRRTETEQ